MGVYGTPDVLRALRSADKGQARACPDRTRAIPCTVRAITEVSVLPIATELAGGSRADVNSDLTVFSLVAAIVYGSGVQQPMRGTATHAGYGCSEQASTYALACTG